MRERESEKEREREREVQLQSNKVRGTVSFLSVIGLGSFLSPVFVSAVQPVPIIGLGYFCLFTSFFFFTK